MIINHNMPAMNAHRQLYGIGTQSAKTMEKLSSGLRINRAADDAAGLAISESMRNAIRGMNQASRNSQDAISLLQTAEGSLSQAQEIMGRIKELAVQASNDTYTANDRIELQKEVDALKGELNRVANSCNFNGKNLLDGSSAALVSADKGTTHVIVRGSIRNADGTTAAGDYKITIDSNPGANQILKSSIFKNLHAGDTVQNLFIDANEGLNHLSAEDIAHGNYMVSTSAGTGAANASVVVAQFYASTGSAGVAPGAGSCSITGYGARNASVLLSCTYAFSNIVQFNVTWMVASTDGSYTLSNGVVHQSSTVVTCSINGAGASAFALNTSLTFSMNVSQSNLKAGDEMVINVKASMTAVNDQVTIRNNSYCITSNVNWAFNRNGLNSKTDELHFFSLDTDGTVHDGSVSLSVSGLGSFVSGTSFDFQEGLGEVSSLDTQLKDIDRFYDPNGRFMVENPQVLTLVMGNGTQTSFSIFGTDTLKMIKDKLNTAIASGLGQEDLVAATSTDKFVNYVTKPDTTTGSTETMEGGFVIRTAMAGKDGAISVVADEGIINALGLTTAQEATDSQFTVTVTDPLDATKIYAQNLTISGNELSAVIHPNVDVKFDGLADMTATWNANSKTFDIATNAATSYTTYIHLVDNTQVFQVGGSEGQSMQAAIGDMRLEALGIDNTQITDVESAVKTIAKMDTALSRISTQRASLGAVQNRCEYNISNLGTASENLQASESRIRDADMAKEMMNFARLNILQQSTMAMLAQANQQPQQVLQLLGR